MLKKLLLLSFPVIFFCLPLRAQFIVEGGNFDSVVINFDTLQINSFTTDSSGLWQIGNTTKAYFTQGGTPAMSIMTDTTNFYPVNANAWFQIQFPNIFDHYNTVVNFTHKYQTDFLHDGCIVEFSTDSGATWENVKGDCNGDSNFSWSNSVLTDNLYSETDTLLTGEQAFTGTSNGWINSRIQFFLYLPVKTTDTTSLCQLAQEQILLRFRFVSDSISDSLDGWIISNITIENDQWAAVNDPYAKKQLNIHPNPSINGIIIFPKLQVEEGYSMTIINSTGQTILKGEYQHQINLNQYPKGLYFYQVTNGSDHYDGKILLE